MTHGGADRAELLKSVSVVQEVSGRKYIAHRLDARYGPMDPKELVALLRELAAGINTDGVDYIVGFPEGGTHASSAFAEIVDRPLILSTRHHFVHSPAISFDEPHTRLGRTHYLYGLHEGEHVVIIEDEMTTGQTVVNAVRALRASGIHVVDVGVVLALDKPTIWRRMADEAISLHVGIRVPPECVEGAVGPDTS